MANSEFLRLANDALSRGDYPRVYELGRRALQAQPDNLDALYVTGGAAMQLNRIDEAMRLFTALLSSAPEHKGAHANLARCHLARHDLVRARQHALTAATSQTPSDLMTASVVLSRCGEVAEARKGFKKLSKRWPQSAEVHFNLGSAAKFLGKFKESTQAYEQAIQLEPKHLAAHAALAELPGNPQVRIPRLRALIAEQPSAEAYYAVARDLEREGRYSEAFEAFNASADLRRQQQNYDFQQDQTLFEAATSAFARWQYDPSSYSDAQPIFVMGLPRSGTTLVERILSQHRAVASGGELNFAALLAKQLSGDNDANAINANVLAKQNQIDVEKFALRYEQIAAEIRGPAQRLVDKFPVNYFYLPLLRNAFPKASLIVLRRNPLDIILSSFRQLFASGSLHQHYTNNLADCARYVIAYEQLIDGYLANTELNVIEVRYDELVANPAPQIQSLVESCQLSADPACFKVERNTAPLSTASAYQARQPISTSSVERWRHYAPQLQDVITQLQAAWPNWQP